MSVHNGIIMTQLYLTPVKNLIPGDNFDVTILLHLHSYAMVNPYLLRSINDFRLYPSRKFGNLTSIKKKTEEKFRTFATSVTHLNSATTLSCHKDL